MGLYQSKEDFNMKRENKIRLNVLIPPKFKNALQDRADREGVTVTDIVTRALSKELRRKIPTR